MNHVQIDLGTVIGGLGVLLSVFLGIYSGLLRYTIAHHDQESNRRFLDLEAKNKAQEAEHKALAERLRLDELATEKISGRLAVVEASQGGITRALEEMRAQQVPRAEWERQIRTMEGQLATITGHLTQLLANNSRAPLGSVHPA